MKNYDFLKRFILLGCLFMPLISCFGQDSQKNAKIQLQCSIQDSLKIVTATVNEVENNATKGLVPNVEVHFYVQRSFSLFPFGKEGMKTDSSGRISAQFPDKLPGDSAGNVMIIAKLENLSKYADAEIKEKIKWGTPVISNQKFERRSLWAAGANAPITLLILVNSLIAAAWGLIFFIFYKIYAISRM